MSGVTCHTCELDGTTDVQVYHWSMTSLQAWMWSNESNGRCLNVTTAGWSLSAA